MKIEKIEIKNFRSLKDVVIYPKNILSLVGKNNSGKSNVLEALGVFFENSIRLINDGCFFNNKLTKTIEITLTFINLSSWESERLGSWMKGDKLVVGSEIKRLSEDKYEITRVAHISLPKFDYLRVKNAGGESVTDWWNKKENIEKEHPKFIEKMGNSKPKVGEWKKFVEEYIKKHSNEIEMVEEKVPNPAGYPNVLSGTLPEFIFIPAVRNVLEETKVSKSNPFGKLIGSITDKISKDRLKEISKRLEEVHKNLNRAGGKDRFKEIQDIETNINNLMSELMDADVEIEIPMPRIQEIFGGAKISVDDGVRTPIETKGHGMQRSMIFTILRAYANYMNELKTEDSSSERNTIFAFEEPELYLHPNMQRSLYGLLKEISSGNDQVFYSTHSNLFLDISRFDEICLMRASKDVGGYESKPTQLTVQQLLDDLKVRKKKEGTEKVVRELYANVFDDSTNEGFFADKVFLVEGSSEKYILPLISKELEYDLDKMNISVINCLGKGSIDRLLRMFDGFNIPTYTMFDGDKDKKDKAMKKKTIELLVLFGEKIENIESVKTTVTKNFCVLEYDLEKTLTKEVSDYDKLMEEANQVMGGVGKPLRHKYAINKLVEQKGVKGLPKTLVSVIKNSIKQSKPVGILSSL